MSYGGYSLDPHLVKFKADDFIRAIDIIEHNGWNNGGQMRAEGKRCYVAAVAEAVHERLVGGGIGEASWDTSEGWFDPMGFAYDLPVDLIRGEAGRKLVQADMLPGPAGKTIRWNDCDATVDDVVEDMTAVADYLLANE